MSLLELFCAVDDFWQAFAPAWQQKLLTSGQRQRLRARDLSESEMMTIVIHFHQARYRDFKTYYTEYVQVYLRREFPKLISYERFIQLLPSILEPLCVFLRTCFGHCSGIAFIDSSALAVCDNRRIHNHKVFDGWAARGKTSMGWFFGVKLHLVINDRGELLAVRVTPGNVDDRKPVPALVKRLWGKLFGDKGYLSKALRDQLRAARDRTDYPAQSQHEEPIDAPERQAAITQTRHHRVGALINSRTFLRLNTRAIAARSTSWCIWSPGCLLTVSSPRNLRLDWTRRLFLRLLIHNSR